VLANSFLAYFVGWDRLIAWMTSSPAKHPTAFAVMLGTTLLMFLDFAWFREQTCIVACPYGRFQSVLLDRQSLIVGYDAARGEPRAPWRRRQQRSAGDCIDCRLCVSTCPTGIDIRGGLQMECIACTQCIDACDAVMDRVGLPRGLVRYTSEERLASGPQRVLRPRVVVYSGILALAFGALAFSLGGQESADVTLLRGLGAPYQVLPSGEVSNQLRIKIANRSGVDRSYSFEIVEPSGLTMIAPENPLAVAAGDDQTTAAFVNAAASVFSSGELPIVLRVRDGVDFDRRFDYRLLGPAGSP
jgi:cytochrome c oxidase accessory protein FixG